MASAADRIVTKERQRFARLNAALDAVSPLKVLSRGYAIATGEKGNILRHADDVRLGEKVRITLEKGAMQCKVEEIQCPKN